MFECYPSPTSSPTSLLAERRRVVLDYKTGPLSLKLNSRQVQAPFTSSVQHSHRRTRDIWPNNNSRKSEQWHPLIRLLSLKPFKRHQACARQPWLPIRNESRPTLPVGITEVPTESNRQMRTPHPLSTLTTIRQRAVSSQSSSKGVGSRLSVISVSMATRSKMCLPVCRPHESTFCWLSFRSPPPSTSSA